MISAGLSKIIYSLVTEYKALPSYKKFFFPKIIASAINALPERSQDYSAENIRPLIIACLNKQSLFKGSFNCLNRFSDNICIKNLNTSLLDEQAFIKIVVPHREAFQQAAKQGSIDVLERLLGNRNDEMVRDNNYAGFRLAGEHGKLEVLQYLADKTPPTTTLLQDMIAANGYAVFYLAAKNGHNDILLWLKRMAPSKLLEMIKADNYAAFRMAAEGGHFDTLLILEQMAPTMIHEMIKADDYMAYRMAAQNGNIQILEYIKKKAHSTFERIIAANNYAVFRMAAQKGLLDVLKYLEATIPSALRTMIVANDYASFKMAAENGHLHILQYLEAKAPNELKMMIGKNKQSALCMAAKNGQLEIIKYLFSKAPDAARANIRDVFCMAAENGHLDILEYLESVAPHQLQMMIAEDNYLAFRKAEEKCQINILKYLQEKAPDHFIKMLAASNYHAAANGNLDVLDYLLTNTNSCLPHLNNLTRPEPHVLRKMQNAYYISFCLSAKNGQLHILNYLEQKTLNQFQIIIAACANDAFSQAAENGHLNILQYLESKTRRKLNTMASANNYYAFRMAAKNGHLHVLEYLAIKAPHLVKKMITINQNEAFRMAAENGHLHILKFLEANAPHELMKMIQANNYAAFRMAAKNGHLHILKYIESKVHHLTLQDMISAPHYNFEAFLTASENGHLPVLQYLGAKAPSLLPKMITAKGCKAYWKAAANGHLPILEYIGEKANRSLDWINQQPGEVTYLKTTKSESHPDLKPNAAFQLAAQNGFLPILEYIVENVPNRIHWIISFDMLSSVSHHHIFKYLLNFPQTFDYIDQHPNKYEHFISEILNDIYELKRTATQPDSQFNVADSKANQLFYVIRHLIKRDNPGDQDHIKFLLMIPAVRALAHQKPPITYVYQRPSLVRISNNKFNHGRPNDLLQVAFSLDNEPAVRCLLGIKEVRTLAIRDNYYREAPTRQLDLQSLIHPALLPQRKMIASKRVRENVDPQEGLYPPTWVCVERTNEIHRSSGGLARKNITEQNSRSLRRIGRLNTASKCPHPTEEEPKKIGDKTDTKSRFFRRLPPLTDTITQRSVSAPEVT